MTEQVSPLDLDLSGLGPAVISVGADDALVAEARTFIAHDNPDWKLLDHPGVGHGFVSGQGPADVEAMARTLRVTAFTRTRKHS